MDLREQKTKKNIRNAFLELRAHKPLERITVKELAELVQISKATFYLHYQDITLFTMQLFSAFHAQQHLIDILFSGTQASVLPIRIESALKEHIFRILPDTRDDARFNIFLTYQIQGGYYAYSENRRRFGDRQVLDALKDIMDLLHP